MEGFCTKTANIWQLLGNVVLILKIVVPLIIIIIGVIEFGKASFVNDDKAIKKSVVTLIKKVITGIIIFFIPGLVSLAFRLIGSFEALNGEYTKCVNCITSPGSCDTSYTGEIFKI